MDKDTFSNYILLRIQLNRVQINLQGKIFGFLNWLNIIVLQRQNFRIKANILLLLSSKLLSLRLGSIPVTQWKYRNLYKNTFRQQNNVDIFIPARKSMNWEKRRSKNIHFVVSMYQIVTGCRRNNFNAVQNCKFLKETRKWIIQTSSSCSLMGSD